MRTKLAIAVFVVFVLLLPVSVFGQGEENYPKRIISLAPAITEELYLLGLENKIVGVTTYCLRPPDAQRKEKIGTVIKVNIEKIISLEPDLVLCLPMTSLSQIEKLKKLGVKVVSFGQRKDFFGVCEQFLELGEIVGRRKQAEQIVSITKNKMDSIKKKVKKLQKSRVFIQIGSKPLFTAIENSFIHDFIELSGGINIALGAKTGLYSREEVLRKNPDVIIIVTMGIAGEQEKKAWQKYKTLNAVRNERIYIMDPYKACSPTPVSFIEVLEEIIGLIYEREGF